MDQKQLLSLKPGTKLKVRDTHCSHFKDGQVVTFKKVRDNDELYVEESPLSWLATRFDVLPPLFKRAKNGRFISDAQGPIRLTPPAGLRNGQIYAVERKRGTTIARLKYQFDDNVVMLSHDQPFLAKRGKVKIANVTEVQEYLKK